MSESCETRALPPTHGERAATEPQANDIAADMQNPNRDDQLCEAIASSCGDGKGRVAETARPLRLQCGDCDELLHQLSNVITPILVHAQMLEWKLPPYSHLKRAVRQLERNARRGSELVKALTRRASDGDPSAAMEEMAVDAGHRGAWDREGKQPHKRM